MFIIKANNDVWRFRLESLLICGLVKGCIMNPIPEMADIDTKISSFQIRVGASLQPRPLILDPRPQRGYAGIWSLETSL